MRRIEIAEHRAEPDGSFTARVTEENDQGELTVREVTVRDPAERHLERGLTWYFEEHQRFPFLDGDRRDDVVGRITTYGRVLFSQVFEGGTDPERIEIVGSAAFQRLHWEALRDPETGDALALRVPIVRRIPGGAEPFTARDGQHTLNLLVVTARPHGAPDVGYRDVGYRTISRPLLDAVGRAGLPVTVDLVRPGTWAALRERLREAGAGHYHLVHFDVPGEGLLLESGPGGEPHAVAAAEVAALLAEFRVPMAVLTAGRSANAETSLAQELAEAGVPVTVGMAYAATVSAAEQAMPVFYEHLARGADPVEAMHRARLRLHEVRGRRGWFGQDVDLEDWLLPVVFARRTVAVRLETPDVAPAPADDEPSLRYGFVGRDLDILAIERRLLREQGKSWLLVRGMAGSGKSALLAHLAWWWRRTGLVDRSYVFRFAERAWTADEISSAIAGPEGTGPERTDSEGTGSEGTALEGRALLVLDDIPADDPALAALLAGLGDRTLIIFSSRGADSDNVYELRGLDPQAASTLTGRILADAGARQYLGDPALDELLTMLGGYPQPLVDVLPALATRAPGGMMAAPGGYGPLEDAFDRLDVADQLALLSFAPFTSTVPAAGWLQRYHEKLGSPDGLDLPHALSAALRAGLVAHHPVLDSWAVLQPMLPALLRARGASPATAQAHYELYQGLGYDVHKMMTTGTPDQRRAGTTAAQAEYANLTSSLRYGLATGQPAPGSLFALAVYLQQRAEYPKLRKLIDDAIAGHRGPAESPWFADLHGLAGRTALDQNRYDEAATHYDRELELRRALGDRRAQRIVHHQVGSVALKQRRHADAERHFRQALEIYLEEGDRLGATLTQQALAQLAQHFARWNEAETLYRQALATRLELGDRHGSAALHHGLGVVMQLRHRWEEAEGFYTQALGISLEFDDHPGASRAYYQLGTLAQDLGRIPEAEARYRQSLEIDLRYDDRPGAAMTYHQLGTIAADQQRWPEAAALFTRAVAGKEAAGDVWGAAWTSVKLGTCLLDAAHPADAIPPLLRAAGVPDHREAALAALRRAREALPDGEFAALVPDDVLKSLEADASRSGFR